MTQLSVEIPFSGFYETSHDAAFDSWLEYEQEVLESEHGATIEQVQKLAELFWYCVDWKAAHTDYAREYCAALCRYVKDESGLELAIEFEELKSPRFYNYDTDRIYGKIAIEQLAKMRRDIPADLWAEFVRDNCTSYDGFISFYDADVNKWPDDLNEWGEAGLGMLLRAYLLHLVGDDDKLRDALSWEIMEDASGNGFISDYIWSNASAKFTDYCDSLRKDA